MPFPNAISKCHFRAISKLSTYFPVMSFMIYQFSFTQVNNYVYVYVEAWKDIRHFTGFEIARIVGHLDDLLLRRTEGGAIFLFASFPWPETLEQHNARMRVMEILPQLGLREKIVMFSFFNKSFNFHSEIQNNLSINLNNTIN